ncbi:hypothetical protein MJI69_32235, partial [Salmonella enterica subsp. enterica serovar Anatum]|nr:hypothetical protein [Salmonella enterica subsp. enterica serovar Anatum]
TETALTRLAWPGNVRQLENTCRWLTVMAAGQEVLIQDLPGELWQNYLHTVSANRQISPQQLFPGAQAIIDGLTSVGGDTAK